MCLVEVVKRLDDRDKEKERNKKIKALPSMTSKHVGKILNYFTAEAS